MADDLKNEDHKGQEPAIDGDPSSSSQVNPENEHEYEGQSTNIIACHPKKKTTSKKNHVQHNVTTITTSDTDKAVNITSKSNELSGRNNTELDELIKSNYKLIQQFETGRSSKVTADQSRDEANQLQVENIMNGLALNGKNVKDMASYKFWGTQPVPKFGKSETVIEEGPFKIIDPEQVPKQPGPLVNGFEWVTMDLTDDKEIEELFTLLYGHYVEDEGSLFRFNYSKSFLKW